MVLIHVYKTAKTRVDARWVLRDVVRTSSDKTIGGNPYIGTSELNKGEK